MTISAVPGREGRLRNLLWVGAFLALLAAMLFPLIILSASYGHEISIAEQAALIALATLILQSIRRQSFWDVFGRPDLVWGRELGLGLAAGALLMAMPALFLWLGGWAHFQLAGTEATAILKAVLLMAAVALAEELLFRGFLFQRLLDALGTWPAQLVLAGLFLLTHLSNPGMDGSTRIWAGINIFLASIMFGIAYLRTRSLALPIGLHFMANVTQGLILGFGLSGTDQPSILKPELSPGQDWLTGGTFGLEASLPGLIAVAASTVMLALWRPRRTGPAGP